MDRCFFCTYAVHDVHVQPVGVVLVQHGRAFFPEVSKVGGQDGWRNDRLRRHNDLQQKATLALRVGIGASVDGGGSWGNVLRGFGLSRTVLLGLDLI